MNDKHENNVGKKQDLFCLYQKLLRCSAQEFFLDLKWKKKSWLFQAIVSCIISKIIDVRNWAIDFLEAFKNRDWSPKFETGLNIIIGIVQKLKK